MALGERAFSKVEWMPPPLQGQLKPERRCSGEMPKCQGEAGGDAASDDSAAWDVPAVKTAMIPEIVHGG